MKIYTLGLAPLVLLAGCTYQEPTYPVEVIATRSPANASSGIRPVRPASVTGSYTHRVPIEPRSWRERNIPETPTDQAPVRGADVMIALTNGRVRLRAFVFLAAPLVLSGCVGVMAGAEQYQTKTAGFSNVKHFTRKATGKRTVWVQSRAEAEVVSKRVRDLAGKNISADTAVQIALLNNKGLQASYASVGTAAAEAWQQSLLVNPTVAIGVTGIAAPEVGAFRTLEGLVTNNILAMLTREKRVARADTQFRQSQMKAVQATLVLAAETRRAWIDSVAAFERVTYLKQALAAADASSDLAKELGRSGAIPKAAQGREHAFYAELTGQVAQARRDARLAKEQLTRLMGLWGSELHYTVPDRLPTIRGRAITKPRIEAEALRKRVDLQIARLELEAVAQSYGLTDATRTLSDLEIIAGVEAEKEIESEFELVTDANGNPELEESDEKKTIVTPQIEIEFAIPIFDSGKARLRKAELAYMRAANELAEKAVNIRSEARSAYTDYRSSREIALHYRDKVVPLRKLIQDESLLTYNGMITNTFELLADARSQINAYVQSVEAKQRFYLAKANLSATIYGGAAGQGGGAGGETAAVAEGGGGPH